MYMLKRILIVCCILNIGNLFGQLSKVDHPLLFKQLNQVYCDSGNKLYQQKQLEAFFNKGYAYNIKTLLNLGTTCFTIEKAPIRLGSNFKLSKPQKQTLPVGSMVWIVGYDSTSDSVRISPDIFDYHINYQVYIPSLKKMGFINGQYLPDCCISTRNYSNLDSLQPQNTLDFQSFHSFYKNVPRDIFGIYYGSDSILDITEFMNNWIHIGDRVFQFHKRKLIDSSDFEIVIETGIVNYRFQLQEQISQTSEFLGSPIHPWVHGAKGLMGVRNVLEIQHMSECCGSEAGSSYMLFMENQVPEYALYKLGHFHATCDGDIYCSSENLIFPSDTFTGLMHPIQAESKITGRPNYIIQFNHVLENTLDEETENLITFENDEMEYAHTKTNQEIKYNKWDRNPAAFKKIVPQ
jgi:hypothetical protein